MSESPDVIAAISTPLGEGGIGIVRLSGRGAFNVVMSIFQPKSGGGDFPRGHRLYYGHIKDEQGHIVDEVLVSFMPSPWTYTREDIVEINCHSGILTLRIILDLVLSKGARMAEPGEFTRRAFINGRIDLSQAESVLTLVKARSEKALKASASNLGGGLSKEIASLREGIISMLALIDASLDFPEEVDCADTSSIKEEIRRIFLQVSAFTRDAERGVLYQEGLKIAIAGKPNVGKSSLLNRLLRKQRAIVTDIPGTTRDLLDEYVTIRGIPLRLIDTAGIRKPRDPVEQIGMDRSREAIEISDLVLLLIDASTGLEDEDRQIMDIIRKTGNKIIVAINKIDLADVSEETIKTALPAASTAKISVKEKRGIDKLEGLIVSMVENEHSQLESPMIISVRHKEILSQTEKILAGALESMETYPLDLISIDLRAALEKLGEITGDTANDETLDRIFSNFCIGK